VGPCCLSTWVFLLCFLCSIPCDLTLRAHSVQTLPHIFPGHWQIIQTTWLSCKGSRTRFTLRPWAVFAIFLIFRSKPCLWAFSERDVLGGCSQPCINVDVQRGLCVGLPQAHIPNMVFIRGINCVHRKPLSHVCIGVLIQAVFYTEYIFTRFLLSSACYLLTFPDFYLSLS
jgi:hypothetical protein